jgi:hypothetical protein
LRSAGTEWQKKKDVPLGEATPGKLLILLSYALVPVQVSFFTQSFFHKKINGHVTTMSTQPPYVL